jgi:outer membrane protein assembly factor BamA
MHVVPKQEDGGRPRRDALGGDFFAALLAELRCKLPLAPLANAGIYGRAFLNGGSAMLLTGQPSAPVPGPRGALAELAATSRWSVVRARAYPGSTSYMPILVQRPTL